MAARITGASTPRRKPSVAGRETDAGAVLLDGTTGIIFELNQIASVVWSCLDGTTTLDELVTDLSNEFGAARERVRTDVLELVAQLQRSGLLDDRARDRQPVPVRMHAPDPKTRLFLAEPPSP